MSSEPILKYGKAGRNLWGECCTYDRPEQLLMLNKGTSFVDCDACDVCPVNVLGVTLSGPPSAPLNAAVYSTESGTFALNSINLAIGDIANLLVELNQTTSVVVSDVSFTGDTLTVPPIVPFSISSIGSDIAFATLDTSVAGSFSVSITATITCGVVTFVQPFVVIP